MSNVGLGFYVPNQVRLTFHGRSVDVDFSDAGVSRLIVIEPVIRQALPLIVAAHDSRQMTWADLRCVLEAQGLDLRAEVARNWAEPSNRCLWPTLRHGFLMVRCRG
ncbi:hypothetical protein [Falsiroseomonas sp. HW251]|uniref:hypothetical protein n=1 Tax=Falsiroseomonas sp. HW251 TaxID=3390998 RepID=UPI003D322D34